MRCSRSPVPFANTFVCRMYGSPEEFPRNSKSSSSWLDVNEDSCSSNATITTLTKSVPEIEKCISSNIGIWITLLRDVGPQNISGVLGAQSNSKSPYDAAFWVFDSYIMRAHGMRVEHWIMLCMKSTGLLVRNWLLCIQHFSFFRKFWVHSWSWCEGLNE